MSGSSKRNEIDVEWLRENSLRSRRISEELTVFQISERQKVILGYNGEPINFSDRAELGPVIALIHGEILCALHEISKGNHTQRSVLEVPVQMQQEIASIWSESFVRRGDIVYGGMFMDMR